MQKETPRPPQRTLSMTSPSLRCVTKPCIFFLKPRREYFIVFHKNGTTELLGSRGVQRYLRRSSAIKTDGVVLKRRCIRTDQIQTKFAERSEAFEPVQLRDATYALFATSTVDGPAAAQSSSLRHQSFRISSLSICIGRRCSGNQETGVARPRGLFWRVRSCWARRVPAEIIDIAAGLKPVVPSAFALRLRYQ